MSMLKIVRTTLAATAIAAGTFTAATTIGSTDAEARRLVVRIGHAHHHRHHYRRHFIAPVVFAAYAGSCYWLKERAENTGRSYWWARYEACIGR